MLMLLLGLSFFGCCLTAVLPAQAKSGSPHGKSIRMACTKCHSDGSFTPLRPSPDFDHSITGFHLKGMHSGFGCRICHSNLVFTEIGTQCADCHADIHRRQLGPDCADCHSIRGWRGLTRIADGHTNRFPLLGAHAALECESCHTGAATGQFRGLGTDCDSCHHSDYVHAESVDHPAAGFSLNCETCHNMDSWLSPFNHDSAAGFALSGAHSTLECSDCHTKSAFGGNQADCAACHLDDYIATTNPVHASAQTPQDCSLCHSSSGWLDAPFDHNRTPFRLTGAHASLDCRSCHGSGQYAGLPSACYSCHADDYNGTSDPAHAAAGFSQECAQCHSTSGWPGASFTHGTFPIYGGTHARVWSACSDCHTNPGSYAAFSCTSCHGRTGTDSNHSGISSYVYSSSNCYACHPDGRRD